MSRPVSDAQKRALAKYVKEKTHQYALRFFPADEALWEHLQKQPKKAAYIKKLIEQDMARSE